MFQGMWKQFKEVAERHGKKYDIIFLSHVLEHIVNPLLFIEELKAFCDYGVFIEVPTLDYKFEEEPFGMFCEEHVNIFTLESLYHLMSKAGFSLLNTEMIMGIGEFLPAGYPAISTFWRIGNGDDFHLPVLKSEQILRNYLRNSHKLLDRVEKQLQHIPDQERLAVWGIGHHSAMLLANTSLRKKNIVAAYDSDERKEGKLFAGVSIHPFKLDEAKDSRIEAILLTTYTAQRTILKFIETLQLPMKIYTLYDI